MSNFVNFNLFELMKNSTFETVRLKKKTVKIIKKVFIQNVILFKIDKPLYSKMALYLKKKTIYLRCILIVPCLLYEFVQTKTIV